MLKKIDNVGRIVIPEPFRKEIGVGLDEYVEMTRSDDKIIITKMNNMLSEEAIKHLYNTWKQSAADSEYDRGFGDALKTIIGEEN